jgi:hypothetical protein
MIFRTSRARIFLSFGSSISTFPFLTVHRPSELNPVIVYISSRNSVGTAESLPHLDDALCFQTFVERQSDTFSMQSSVSPKILHSANQFPAFSETGNQKPETRNRKELCHSPDILLRTPEIFRLF